MLPLAQASAFPTTQLLHALDPGLLGKSHGAQAVELFPSEPLSGLGGIGSDECLRLRPERTGTEQYGDLDAVSLFDNEN